MLSSKIHASPNLLILIFFFFFGYTKASKVTLNRLLNLSDLLPFKHPLDYRKKCIVTKLKAFLLAHEKWSFWRYMVFTEQQQKADASVQVTRGHEMV